MELKDLDSSQDNTYLRILDYNLCAETLPENMEEELRGMYEVALQNHANLNIEWTRAIKEEDLESCIRYSSVDFGDP